MKNSVESKVAEILEACTSEHPDMVRARVVMMENSVLVEEKIPIIYKDELFLAIFDLNFVLIVELQFLNIRDMIFMIDNEIVDCLKLPVNLANFM